MPFAVDRADRSDERKSTVSYPTHTTAPKKKSRVWLVVTLVLFTVTAVCLCGVAVATSSGGEKPDVSTTTASAGQPPSVAATKAGTVPVTPQPTAAAAAKAAPNIEDGTWTVGEDFPAGTYKTTGAGDTCYWAIYKSGQNQSFDSMVDNHLGGGNLRVSLKAGQDFETKRCGTWAKV